MPTINDAAREWGGITYQRAQQIIKGRGAKTKKTAKLLGSNPKFVTISEAEIRRIKRARIREGLQPPEAAQEQA